MFCWVCSVLDRVSRHALVLGVAHGERSRTVGNPIAGHGLVAAEFIALQLSFGRDDADELVAPHFMQIHIPEQFFGLEDFVFSVADDHTTSQLPHLLVVKIGGVGLDIEIYMEVLVEAFHEQPFFEFPGTGAVVVFSACIDVPFLGNHMIAHHSGV